MSFFAKHARVKKIKASWPEIIWYFLPVRDVGQGLAGFKKHRQEWPYRIGFIDFGKNQVLKANLAEIFDRLKHVNILGCC